MSVSDRGSYIRAVEAHFLKYRGTGFVLSPKDEALVDSWYEKKIPLQNILRGLDEAVTQMRERESRLHFRPRSISYFARSVEAHSKVASTPTVSVSTEEVVHGGNDLQRKLLVGLRDLETRLEARDSSILRSIGRKIEEASNDGVWGLLPALDADLNRLMSEHLPTDERIRLQAEAEQIVRRECGPYLSPKAKMEQEAEAMADLCRAHFDFEGLMALATRRNESCD